MHMCIFFSLSLSLCGCMCVYMCRGVYVEIRRLLSGVGFLLPPHGYLRSKLGIATNGKVYLPTEPSCSPYLLV